MAIKEIASRLSNDFEFDLITAKFEKNLPPREKIGNVTVWRIGFGKPNLDKILLPFLGALKAHKLHRKNNYFCFWSVMASFGGGTAYLLNIFYKIFGMKKVPIVLSLQEGDSEDHFKYRWLGLVNLSWKMALKRTDFLTALSHFLLDRAKKKYGFTGPKVLVPNGVDVSFFSAVSRIEQTEEVLRKIHKKSGEILLVTVSRLVHKNAIDDVVSSMVYLPTHIRFIILGNGPEIHNLKRQVKKLALSERVSFIGFISHRDLPSYLHQCDIFVRPSRSEGFGNSFIEAMAARIPVIATPVGGIPDFLDDRETGIFCAPDDPKSVAEAVKTILSEKSLREHMISSAFNRVSNLYDWSRIAELMKNEVFDKI